MARLPATEHCPECHQELKENTHFVTPGCEQCYRREMKGMRNMAKDKESKISEMGKTITIAEEVTDCIERIDCSLAQELQELWDEAFHAGHESRDSEVADLRESLDTLKKKVNAILTALA